MASAPGCHVETRVRVAQRIGRHGVATEQIRHDNQVTGFGNCVGQKTVVDELWAKDICEVDDRCAGVVMAFRVSQVKVLY